MNHKKENYVISLLKLPMLQMKDLISFFLTTFQINWL